MIDDPWAAASLTPAGAESTPEPMFIAAGATVLEVVERSVRGRYYRCQTWMTQYPWRLDRKTPVIVYRGDTIVRAELAGEATLAWLRKNSQDVQSVWVGAAGPEPEVDIWLAGEAEPQVGDTLEFPEAGFGA
jgi:hypothetical protein